MPVVATTMPVTSPERTSPRPAPIEVVAFDLMDTVLADPYRPALEAATGIPVAALMERRDPGLYPAFERGEIDEAAYWRSHAELGITVDPSAFHAVRRARTVFVDGMERLLDDLAGSVVRVAASNYPIWIEELAQGLLAGRFERIVASCHLGVRKPDREFFERLAAVAVVQPARVAFVDDRERNVRAARAAGMAAHRFVGADPLRRWLVTLGVDLVS